LVTVEVTLIVPPGFAFVADRVWVTPRSLAAPASAGEPQRARRAPTVIRTMATRELGMAKIVATPNSLDQSIEPFSTR
jgi:hypothetical protein